MIACKLLMKTQISLVVLSLLLPSLVARADDKPAAESKINDTPWHLVDLWWNIGQDAPFESYSVDVTISDDLPEGVHLYISPIGLGHFGKQQFYGGIQTRADGNTKSDHNLREIGPGLLFSMWGQRSFDAIRPADGGFCQSSGHEGDFVSVRRPYKWQKGTYTYRLVKMDKETVDGQPQTWVGAFVYSHDKDENIFVGALRFHGDSLVLSRHVASFVEIYGPRIPLSEIPKVTVTFSKLTLNGQLMEKPTAEAVYPDGVPDYAEATGKDGAVTIVVGKPIENRAKRKVELLK
jgi:hypothetical protein